MVSAQEQVASWSWNIDQGSVLLRRKGLRQRITKLLKLIRHNDNSLLVDLWKQAGNWCSLSLSSLALLLLRVDHLLKSNWTENESDYDKITTQGERASEWGKDRLEGGRQGKNERKSKGVGQEKRERKDSRVYDRGANAAQLWAKVQREELPGQVWEAIKKEEKRLIK